MSEASHDFSDEGFHEIHLTGKQLVFLFMATTVVSVIIFLCGVLVGRGVPVQTAQDPLVGTTAAAAADPSPTPSQAPPPATEPTAARAEVPSPTPEEAGEDLTYKKRLEEESAAKESVKPRQPEPVPARSRPPAAAPEPPSPPPQPGTWVVQVHALRDRNVANGIVQRLTGKGYPAFLVASGPPTGTYKVQVGRFKDRDEAARVVERLKKEEQFKPWITR